MSEELRRVELLRSEKLSDDSVFHRFDAHLYMSDDQIVSIILCSSTLVSVSEMIMDEADNRRRA